MRRKSLKRLILYIPVVFLMLSFSKAKEITWVAIGDSITYLNDHPDETGNRTSKGYLTMVQEAVADLHYINQGHNGWTTSGIAKEIEKLGIVKADIYTVFIGTNDWWSGIPIGTLDDYLNDTGTGTTCGSYRKIINKIRSLNHEARIILITPMQRNDFVYIANAQNNAFGSYKEKNGQSLEGFANAIAAISKQEKFESIDLYHNKELRLDKLVKYKRLKNPVTGEYKNYKFPESASIPFNPTKDEYPYPPDAMAMTYDGLHPSNKGNAIISKQLVKLFKK
ncbi:SGNH/GDSL hydrolase family protein [Pedobacter metabolipauper]|nr:SGNH/GDSL hydrolase family protein [Pedobacter metabolipauper]